MACQSFFAGDTLDLRYEFADYPASDGWSGKVVLTCAAHRHVADLVADGDAMAGTVLASATATWPPGIYDLNVIVEHTDGRRYVALTDEVVVRPNPGLDTPTRSAFEVQLDAVDAAIAAVIAGQGVASYSITTPAGSRQIQRMSLEELRRHRLWLANKIDAERQALCLKPRNNQWKRIGISFRA